MRFQTRQTRLLQTSISFSLASPFVAHFVVDALKTNSQSLDGVVLSRQQRVDAQSGFRGDVGEAAAVHFVRQKNLALARRQFVERRFQLVNQNASRIKS